MRKAEADEAFFTRWVQDTEDSLRDANERLSQDLHARFAGEIRCLRDEHGDELRRKGEDIDRLFIDSQKLLELKDVHWQAEVEKVRTEGKDALYRARTEVDEKLRQVVEKDRAIAELRQANAHELSQKIMACEEASARNEVLADRKAAVEQECRRKLADAETEWRRRLADAELQGQRRAAEAQELLRAEIKSIEQGKVAELSHQRRAHEECLAELRSELESTITQQSKMIVTLEGRCDAVDKLHSKALARIQELEEAARGTEAAWKQSLSEAQAAARRAAEAWELRLCDAECAGSRRETEDAGELREARRRLSELEGSSCEAAARLQVATARIQELEASSLRLKSEHEGKLSDAASRLQAEAQRGEALDAKRAELASELSCLRRELKEAEEMQVALKEQVVEAELKMAREKDRTRVDAEQRLAAAEQRFAVTTEQAEAVLVESSEREEALRRAHRAEVEQLAGTLDDISRQHALQAADLAARIDDLNRQLADRDQQVHEAVTELEHTEMGHRRRTEEQSTRIMKLEGLLQDMRVEVGFERDRAADADRRCRASEQQLQESQSLRTAAEARAAEAKADARLAAVAAFHTPRSVSGEAPRAPAEMRYELVRLKAELHNKDRALLRAVEEGNSEALSIAEEAERLVAEADGAWRQHLAAVEQELQAAQDALWRERERSRKIQADGELSVLRTMQEFWMGGSGPTKEKAPQRQGSKDLPLGFRQTQDQMLYLTELPCVRDY